MAATMTLTPPTEQAGAGQDWASATGRAAERARASGVLAPIDTYVENIAEQGLAYQVRVLSNIRRKRQAGGAPPSDPFAPPYEPDLWVGKLAPAHVALLNKFPVLDRHLLAVTCGYEPQTNLLTVADCEAMLRLLADWDGLVFYNGGAEAGASQPHKHLQIVDLPMAGAGPGLPVAQALATGDGGNEIGAAPALPFPHARVRMPAWQDPAADGAHLRDLYLDLLAAVGLPGNGPEQPGPYNLLATRQWLWVVPRRRQRCADIEVNALGFAGALMVSDQAHLQALERMGPAACLRTVCP